MTDPVINDQGGVRVGDSSSLRKRMELYQWQSVGVVVLKLAL